MNKKTVFITGAANGIGEAAAKLFLEKGFFIGLYDIDETRLKILSEEIGEANCCYKYCDITDETSVKTAFAHFGGYTGGKLDLLCANAGIVLNGEFESFSSENYKQLINVNAFGTTNTILHAIPLLKQTENSRIVITSSSSGMFGIPKFAVYSGTKSYLKSLTEALSTELKPNKIQVSSVMPLFVETDMMNSIDNKHKAEITPAQVARVIYKAGTTGKKRHYLVGKSLCTFNLLNRLLPTKTFQGFIKWYLKE